MGRTLGSTHDHRVCKEKPPDAWIFTDPWALGNGLARCSGTWRESAQKIGEKDIQERSM